MAWHVGPRGIWQAALRRQAREAEQRVEVLTGELATIEQRLADPAMYEGDLSVLADVRQRHVDLKRELADAEEAWLAAESELEKAG